MKTFNLPDLGEGLPEAEIVTWQVKEGDKVKVDEPLVSVETAKAVVDVPSPETGTVAKLHGAEGDVIETGKPLVSFYGEGEDEGTGESAEEPAEAPEGGQEDADGEREDSGTVVGQMKSGTEVEEETAIIRKKKKKKKGGRVKALPSVRALAKKLGVDLSEIEPSGKNGQVTAADVEQYAEQAATAAPARAEAPAAPSEPARPQVTFNEPERLRGPRRAMSQSMSMSRDQVAACTLFDDADVHYWAPGQDITARIVRAIVAGCRAAPELNAWYDGEKNERILHEHVDIGMAVDTPEGLMVPVLRGVQDKYAEEIRNDLNWIKKSTRERSIKPEHMKDPTITLSNFGMMAGRYATPVVVPPQVAILGTGGTRHDVVPVMGGIEVHKRIPLSITFDHRCITGGEACRFLKAVIDDLEKGV